MKNLALVIVFIVAVVFGSFYMTERRKTAQLNATNATLAERLAAMEQRVSEQEQRTTTLQTRLQDTRAKAVAKADEVTHLEQVLTNRVQTNAKAANPMAEMFKSKEMKELVKTQQKAVFSGMIDKNYSPYFTGMQLSSEQSAGLKDLIMKKSLVDASFGMSLMSGESDTAKRQELLMQAKSEKEAIDQEIKQYLGEANYPQFQTYEKTIPERMSLGMFKDQQAAGPGALKPEQEELLVQAMSEERQNFKFTTDYYDQSKFNGDFAQYFTEDKLNQFQKEREQLHQQYLTRAKDILTEEQRGPFEKFLGSQRDLQDAGMKMAVKMFGKEGN